jgi:hypothetical protein
MKRRAELPQPAVRLRHMVAAATLVRQETLRSISKRKDWQVQAWEMYDEVGELHSATGWLAHSLSRCKLYVAELPEDSTEGDPAPTTNDAAKQPLDELFGGPSGHPGMLSRFAIHLTVPGESYLIGLDLDTPDTGDNLLAPAGETPTPVGPEGVPLVDEPDATRRWLVASQDEFDQKDGKVTVRLPDSDQAVTVDVEKSTVIRLWRPHARKAWDADSPARACLGALRELVTASAKINADLESRLAGAGMLIMPSSATVARQGSGDATDATARESENLVDDPDYQTLIEAMVTPISDRDSASAVVPILVRVDDTSVDKVRHITFATPLDAKVLDLREAAIKRLALGLDVPPEVLLGMTDANHWTGWQIEESAVKLSVEPLLTLIVNALTVNYLRPALRLLGVADVERYVIWYDVSELVLRPNRFEQAYKLWQDGLVGSAAVLREGGFGEDDKPTSTEQARHLLLSLVMKNVSPDVARPYLLALGLPAPAPTANPEVGPAAPPDEPDTVDGESRDLPDTTGNPDDGEPGGATAALVASAGALRAAGLELAVLRALEIAGKRLLSGAGRQYRNTIAGPTWTLHTHVDLRPREGQLDGLLAGAYDTLRESPLGRAPGAVALVDTYVRQLLLAGVAHSPTYLAAAIEQQRRAEVMAGASA